MVTGGSSGKLRDAAPAAFLVGHSTAHMVLKASTLPVYMMREGRLSLPCQHTPATQRSVSNWLHASAVPVAA